MFFRKIAMHKFVMTNATVFGIVSSQTIGSKVGRREGGA